MADIDVLIPAVATHLKGAPDTTVRQYIRRGARQFCKDSRIWVVSLGTGSVDVPADTENPVDVDVPSTGGVTDFTLPVDGFLSFVERITLDGEQVNGQDYAYDVITKMLRIEPKVVHRIMELEIFGALIPSVSAGTIPDFLSELWGDGIVAYAIWEMQRMPDQVWSSAGTAWMFKKQYVERVAEATEHKARRGTSRPIVMPPIDFV